MNDSKIISMESKLLDSKLHEMSEEDLIKTQDELRAHNDKDLSVKISFLFLGWGCLAFFNALMSVLFWIDKNIPGYSIISDTVYINQVFVITTSLFMIYQNIRDQSLLAQMYVVIIFISIFIPVMTVFLPVAELNKQIIQIVIIVIQGITSGIMQSLSFSLASVCGNSAITQNSIGIGVGGSIISILCLFLNESLDIITFNGMQHENDISNSMFMWIVAMTQFTTLIVYLILINSKRIKKLIMVSDMIQEIRQVKVTVNKDIKDFNVSEAKKSNLINDMKVSQGQSTVEDSGSKLSNLQTYSLLLFINFISTFIIFPPVLFANQSKATLEVEGNQRLSEINQTICVVLIQNVIDYIGRSVMVFKYFKMNMSIVVFLTSFRALLALVTIIGVHMGWFMQDGIIYGITGVMAILQGMVATHIFIEAPSQIQDKGLAGMIMNFSLLVGIFTGSVISSLILNFVFK